MGVCAGYLVGGVCVGGAHACREKGRGLMVVVGLFILWVVGVVHLVVVWALVFFFVCFVLFSS